MPKRRRSLATAPRILSAMLLLVALVGPPSAGPAAAAPQLVQIAGGLSSPVYATSARDGTGRLFFVERGGVIKVMRPPGQTPTVFLDITSRVLSAGSEQGLLGLAFHPDFRNNRRFFVNYTRQTDGATIVAEYQVSVANPDVALMAERVILTVPQPFANHNGGMIEFGPDGRLYIAVGDGGDGNDPGDRAQNLDELLGKILRIAVTDPGTSPAYTAPADNPFVGASGRDEIWAYGFRNPWRMSFDRGTGQLWAGDVGQDAIEEIDIVTRGGNYGWRTWEGTGCTGLDGTPCSSSGFIFPVTEYPQAGGRCSVTGGYVYRGPGAALPTGTYVFGDFCSGEILGFAGGITSTLLDTTLNISSFGEDEQGEILVVALGGAVYRLAGGCSFSVLPASRSFPAGGGADTFAVSTAAGCGWAAVGNASWIQVTGGSPGSGSGTVSYTVAANPGTSQRTGTVTAGGQTHTVIQAGTPGSCSFQVSPTRVTVNGPGSAGSVTVTTAGGCGWTAGSNVNWITVSPLSGAGTGAVTYTVAANGTNRQRTGTFTVAGQTVTVRQKR
jgi:glucose/arabinose dehydrogenase